MFRFKSSYFLHAIRSGLKLKNISKTASLLVRTMTYHDSQIDFLTLYLQDTVVLFNTIIFHKLMSREMINEPSSYSYLQVGFLKECCCSEVIFILMVFYSLLLFRGFWKLYSFPYQLLRLSDSFCYCWGWSYCST